MVEVPAGRFRRQRAPRGSGDRLREEILDTATELLLKTGHAKAVSIRSVAQHVGVTPPSIYLHFQDKDALLDAVCARYFAKLDAEMQQAAAGHFSTVEVLRAQALAYVRFAVETPELYRLATMGEWARGAVQAWAATRGTEEQAPTLSNMDVAKLRTLRGAVADLLVGRQPAADEIEAKSTFALSADGELRLAPIGRGWLWLASVLWAEILLAQRTGGWRRLKQCHNPACRSAFYDRSKNNSGVWHNVKTCGNAANLRASRARRRQAQRGD